MYLTCELNKERDVIWKRNGTILKKKAGKVAINIIGLQHAVTIQNATEEDTGAYTCEVEEREDISTTTNVKVIGKQKEPEEMLPNERPDQIKPNLLQTMLTFGIPFSFLNWM